MKTSPEEATARLSWAPYVAAMAVVLALAGITYGTWSRSQTRQARQLVAELLNVPAGAFPYALDKVRPFESRARPLLRAVLGEPAAKPERQLNAALALAVMGEVQVSNLLALSVLTERLTASHLGALAREAGAARDQIGWRMAAAASPDDRARLATVAWSLGDHAPLEHLLAGDANPDRRTAFIHGYPRWGADPLALERLLETAGLVPEHGGLRSGVCAALGLMSGATNTLPPPALDRLRGRLKRLWAEAPDAGTRGAAAYALVRWGGALPALPALPAPAREPAPGRDWFVNEAGLTLVRIPAPERPAGTPDPPPQSFGYRDEWELIPRPFFMSDREITVAQFKAYRAQVGADPQTPPGEVPGRWEGDPSDLSPTPDCPAHSVSWAAAAAYCNWLSRQEGRGACYRVAGTTDWQNPTNWVCDLSVSGYRLPTWAEWRHACAAGSREDFAFGSDPQLLGEYATYAGNYVRTLIPAGGRLPNRWGLFDVHGSVREWAHEWVRLEDVLGARNPERGGVRPQLVSGGGSWAQPASYCRIEMALRDETKHWEIGFRVVLVEARAPDRRGDPAR